MWIPRCAQQADPHSPPARPARSCGTDVWLRTAPLCANAPSIATRTASPTSEIVKHRGDAVGPLLQGRQRARRDGIGRSRARLVEEDQSTKRCHRLNPPLNRRQLRKDLTVGEPVRDEHDVARHPHATCDRRRASPRSSHSASPRTLRKCKPRSGSSFRQCFLCIRRSFRVPDV